MTTTQIQLAIAIGSIVCSIGVAWGYLKAKTMHQEKEDCERDKTISKEFEEIWGQINKQRGLIDSLAEDLADFKLEFEKRMGKHESYMDVDREQYKEVSRRLTDLERK